MNVGTFAEQVAGLEFENAFNPYRDRCEVFDVALAPEIRLELLTKMLILAERDGIESLWVGRDLGYRGGRRTGIALTDEANMWRCAQRWSIDASPVTKGAPVAERTAAVIWEVLDRIIERIFLWNVFPLHPYEKGAPFTNRTHNKVEREAGEEVLKCLIQMLRPKRLIAVGNDAARACQKVGDGLEVLAIRHPSYGGQNVFLSQIRQAYQLASRQASQGALF
ncbi:uracil-DNA glycosylase [Xanthomonas sp. SHU 199]|uniref:uracil-DNA glycosylase n=1 Tax=Xanthomonas sp. SHU 199 TaxID=1591174 RepID=UPI0009D95432|nr:uracil-DNA glycosylase [Xanthomonas sp. SHU 199]